MQNWGANRVYYGEFENREWSLVIYTTLIFVVYLLLWKYSY